MTGAATALPSGLTWEQFLELLDQDEYKSAELIGGQVVVGTPSWLHQRIVAALIRLIGNWVAGLRPGAARSRSTPASGSPTTVATCPMSPGTPRSGSPRRVVSRTGRPISPSRCSPSTRAFDVVRKREDYGRVGVRELWLIDLEGPAAMVLRRDGAGFVVAAELDAGGDLTSPQLPGLVIRLGALLER